MTGSVAFRTPNWLGDAVMATITEFRVLAANGMAIAASGKCSAMEMVA